jgi:4-diphosphocytidyl-2C-methyl-D-erythritol kinase
MHRTRGEDCPADHKVRFHRPADSARHKRFTAKVYAHYIHDVPEYERLSRAARTHIAEGRIDRLARMCANMLETSCYRVCAELGQLKRILESLDIGPVCLSGSGSTLYVLANHADPADFDRLRARVASETGHSSIVVGNNPW